MNRAYPSNPSNKRMQRRQRPVIAVYAVTLVALIVTLVIFSQFLAKRQTGLLYGEKIQMGKMGLNHFVNTAVMPLLEDDALSLNVLMKEAKAIDGILYVVVADNNGRIKAHTDISKIGSILKMPATGDRRVEQDGTVAVNYSWADGTQVLDLSRAVRFMQNPIGMVHVGLSLTFVNGEIQKELSGLMRSMMALGVVLACILLASALGVLFWLSKKKGVMPANDFSGDVPLNGGDGTAEPLCQENEDANGVHGADTRSLSMAAMNQNHVTVLFAGIKGFTAYAEINDHQKLMDDLKDYLSLATECIQNYGGQIDKFVGDSVIAVFDHNPHTANHAERAVKAAVAMQKALQESGKRGNQLLLKVGIGINSGVVLSGRIGSCKQEDQVFIGESIKVAYSLNFMAGPGEIVMTRDAYRMVEHLVTVEPMPPQVLMRRTQPWENFRLVKLKS